jgi:hypothetical protein
MERRRPNQRRELSGEKAAELLSGRIDRSLVDYSGYGGDAKSDNVADFVTEEMKADWLANRKLLLRVWQSGALYPHDVWPDWPLWLSVSHDDPLPWCERVFGGSSSPRK